MGGGRGEPRGLLTLPALPSKLVSFSPAPSLLLLSEAVTQTGWAVLLPLASLPSLVPPPPFLPSLQSLPPSLLSPLVIKENSSWPDLTSNAVPRPPTLLLSSPRPSPSIQPRMPGAPDRGTHKKPTDSYLFPLISHSVMYHAKIRPSNFGFFKTHPITLAHVLKIQE